LKIFKLISINLIVLFSLFIFMEILSRAFFPEFNNQTFAMGKISSGKNIINGNLYGKQYRMKNKNDQFNYSNKSLIVIVGDSITQGYGLDYEDIYWVETKKILNDLNENKIQILPSGGFGSTISHHSNEIKEWVEKIEENKKINHLVYQFNYNDITPKILMTNIKENFVLTKNEYAFHALRYRYLNKSTFLRLMQFYAGRLRLNRSGDCMSRGLDALWRYSWVYGSKIIKDESELLWKEFDSKIQKFKIFLNKKNIKLTVLIVPILLEIDPNNISGQNTMNLDLKCKTIDPHKKLTSILNKNEIGFVSTNKEIKETFESKVLMNNEELFFIAGDYNHINARTSLIVGRKLATHLHQKLR
jgi:hypothetical protein